MKSTTIQAKKRRRERREGEVAKKEIPQLNKYRGRIILALLFFTFLIYSNSLQNGFIYFDDPELVTDNFAIRQITWDNLVHYFTTPVQFTYLPVGLISYAIDYQIGKLDPFIYHLDSLIIHICTVFLVYWLFQLMTKKLHISLFIASIFAIHPVNVDTVAWVATRNNLLTAFFFLASLLLYTFYIEKKFQIKYLIWSVVLFTLSALSKSSSVILPLVLFLWDYYYDRKWDKRLLLEKVPFAVIALILGIVTLNVRQDVVPPVDYTLFDRFVMFLYSLTDYFYRLLFPFQLSMSYAYPQKEGSFLPFYFYLSPLILCLIVWGLYKLKVSKKVLIIGLLFFLLNIFLSQSVLLIDNFMANRYLYLAYVGLFFILADINEQILIATDGWRAKIKHVWMAGLIVFAVAFSVLTYQRNFVWKDTISLFDDVIAKQPNLPWVYSNRGIAKYRNNDFQGALKDFNRSLELDPDFTLSLYYRGVLSYLSNDYSAAITDLDQAIATSPSFAFAYNDRGKAKMALQDYQGAMDDFSMAISLDAYFADAYINRGILRNQLADYQGAVADLDIAISYTPEFAVAHYNRGLAKTKLGDYQGAVNDLSEAINLNPGYAEAFYLRGVAKSHLNDPNGSCNDIQQARASGYQEDPEQINQTCP